MKKQYVTLFIAVAALMQSVFAFEKRHAIDAGLGIQNDLIGFRYSYFIPVSGSCFVAPQLGLGALTIGGGLKASEDLGLNVSIPPIGVSFGKEIDKGLIWAASFGFSYLESGDRPHGETDLISWTVVEAFKYLGIWRRKTFGNSSWYYSLGLELGLHTTKTGEKTTGNQIRFDESSQLTPTPIANIGKSF